MTKAAVTQAIAATITLDTPLTRGETEITELRLRKPTSGELRGVSMGSLVVAVLALVMVVFLVLG